jgi:hypothetical protein
LTRPRRIQTNHIGTRIKREHRPWRRALEHLESVEMTKVHLRESSALRGFVDLVVCKCEVDSAGFAAHVRGGRVFEEVRHVDGGECEKSVGVALVRSCAGEQREEESSRNCDAHFEKGL